MSSLVRKDLPETSFFNQTKSILHSDLKLPKIIDTTFKFPKLKRYQTKIEINRSLTSQFKKSSESFLSKHNATLAETTSIPLPHRLNISFYEYQNLNRPNPKKPSVTLSKHKTLPLETIKLKSCSKPSFLDNLQQSKIEKLMKNLGHIKTDLKLKEQCKNKLHEVENIINQTAFNSLTDIPKTFEPPVEVEIPQVGHRNQIEDYFNKVIKEYQLEEYDKLEKDQVNLFDLYLPKEF